MPPSPRMRLIPTSMTTAPGLTIWAVINPATPAAETSTSPVRVTVASSAVNLLVEITVASARMSSTTIGLPTILLAPTQTHRAPTNSIPVDSIISITARAVHGTKLRRP